MWFFLKRHHPISIQLHPRDSWLACFPRTSLLARIRGTRFDSAGREGEAGSGPTRALLPAVSTTALGQEQPPCHLRGGRAPALASGEKTAPRRRPGASLIPPGSLLNQHPGLAAGGDGLLAVSRLLGACPRCAVSCHQLPACDPHASSRSGQIQALSTNLTVFSKSVSSASQVCVLS